MLIAEVDYGTNFQDLSPSDWAKFTDLWVSARGHRQESYHYYSAGTQRITMEEAAGLQDLGIKLRIMGVDGTMITKMKDQKKWSYGDDVTARDLVSGSAVQITLPDVGLLLIDEVTWREDECTEQIQSMLDDGWRIIAVCPPNAQRRPDYILGRRRKDAR